MLISFTDLTTLADKLDEKIGASLNINDMDETLKLVVSKAHLLETIATFNLTHKFKVENVVYTIAEGFALITAIDMSMGALAQVAGPMGMMSSDWGSKIIPLYDAIKEAMTAVFETRVESEALDPFFNDMLKEVQDASAH